jgi:hypothetical protein
VVREWGNPSGSAVATCLNAAARARRAARAVKDDVVSVWQVLHGTHVQGVVAHEDDFSL